MSTSPGELARPIRKGSFEATELHPRFWRSDATLVGLLILLGALPYTNTLFNAFVYDDLTQVLNNPYIQSFRYLREIFSTTVWSYIGAQRGTNYYRPMMTFGYLICYQSFGPMAYGFHLANVLLHTTTVCIFFLVCWRIFQDPLPAWVAAAMFALHPVHSESVAWIAAVTDLELTTFYLLTFWFFLGVARPGGGRSGEAQLGMVGSYVLTILSKEQALTLPLLAAVYEHFYRRDRAETSWTEKVGRYGNLWLVGMAYVLFRVKFLGSFVPILQRKQLGWGKAFLSAFALFGQYLGKLLWPAHLLAFYPFRESASWLDPRVLAGIAALLIVASVFLALWRHARPASFGVIWLLVTLVPVLNARWLAANAFAERYLYLPSVGFSIVAAGGWASLWAMGSGRKPVLRVALVAALGILGSLCVYRIVTRNRDWQNDLILYTRTLADQPDIWHLRNNLGADYWMRGNFAAAEREWQESLKRSPESPIILSNLGMARVEQKRYDEAVKFFQHAVRSEPRFVDAHVQLGKTYMVVGSRDLAELQFRTAVALAPLNVRARSLLGQLYLEEGRVAEAEEQFLRSVESEATSMGYDGLGDVYLAKGARDQAERAFTRALALDAFDSHAHFKLGTLYAQSGRNSEAMREYQKGLVTDPANPEALAGLARLKGQASHANPPKP